MLDPINFIKKKTGGADIITAQKQQKNISYFTESETQGDVTREYLEQWANRNYAGTDYFLSWLKTILKTDNFMSVFKQIRKPLPSAKLINDEIKPQLKRVFHAEDSYFRYFVGNKVVEQPEYLKSVEFVERMFNAIMFGYNDIVVYDLENINRPYREIVSIDNVVALESHYRKIHRIAYKAIVNINGEDVIGYLYLDKDYYIFYDCDYKEIDSIVHDLGECPADYISSEAFSTNNDIVAKSMFSYIRSDLEEYSILKALQKMCDISGTVPVTTKPKTKTVQKNSEDKQGQSDKEPMSANEIGGQKSSTYSDVNASQSPTQAGSIAEIPMDALVDDTGKLINVDLIKHFLTFHYMPVESLKFLDDRIRATRQNIISTILGTYEEVNKDARNELDVNAGLLNKQDKLRWVSNELTRIVSISDKKMLSLAHGKDRVEVDLYFGSDFFLETTGEILDNLEKSPNPIVSQRLLDRYAGSANKFNAAKREKEKLLSRLLPFATNKDFDTALTQQIVNTEKKLLQTQFFYWISQFESLYGDIYIFYVELGDMSEGQKITVINNLITQIIIQNEQSIINRTPESV